MKTIQEKLALELATYEDGMISFQDYINQTIVVCKGENERLIDEATIRLLKALGELTVDTDINDPAAVMTIASVRIRRLQEELDNDGWIPIVKGLEPEGKVIVAFDDPSWGGYSKEAEAAYFEDGLWRFWLSDRVISTHADGVTHYKELGKLPKEAKKHQEDGDKQ